MTVYLVRHGESLANLYKDLPLQRGFGGMTDDRVPLTQWGYDQAVEAGKVLANELDNADSKRKIKIIYSPFLRTAQTTRGILRQLNRDNLIAGTDDNLREQHFGLFSQITDLDLIARLWPEENAAFMRDRENPDLRHYAKAPGGEGRADVEIRVRELIEQHRADFEDQDMDIIVVGHGMVNRILEMCLCGLDAEWLGERENPGNCAILKLEGDLHNGYTSASYIHEGRTRPVALPKNYKTAAHDGELAIAR